MCFDDQLQQKEKDDKSQTYAANVAGKAFGFGAEIKKVENQHGQYCHDQKIIGSKMNPNRIDVL